MKNYNTYKLLLVLFFIIVITSCVKDNSFNVPKNVCEANLTANATYQQVKDLYEGSVKQIQEDLVIEGYVISSDVAGNFFGTLHIQDSPSNPTQGFQIDIDVRDSYLQFPIGSKILIKLKGLYLEDDSGVFKVGGAFSSFGNLSVGRLPAHAVNQHVYRACDAVVYIQPTIATITELNDAMINTLVQFEEVEFADDELGNMYAAPQEETERIIQDCEENQAVVINSGYSDFQAELLPENSGTFTAIVLKDNDGFKLVIRNLDDVVFTNQRCPEIITEFTSTNIFFSELADPNNNTGARFVELYNSAAEPLDLNGWTLRRYTNANTTVSSTIDLSGYIIGAESTFVISPNATEFETVYGFAPDLGVSAGGPADSNGDDNLELVDPFGTVIDVFGIIGEDGSGTNHEFEDGKAVRNSTISMANAAFTFSEWTVFNDTGAAGTTNLPQNAPDDFTPGVRD